MLVTDRCTTVRADNNQVAVGAGVRSLAHLVPAHPLLTRTVLVVFALADILFFSTSIRTLGLEEEEGPRLRFISRLHRGRWGNSSPAKARRTSAAFSAPAKQARREGLAADGGEQYSQDSLSHGFTTTERESTRRQMRRLCGDDVPCRRESGADLKSRLCADARRRTGVWQRWFSLSVIFVQTTLQF